MTDSIKEFRCGGKKYPGGGKFFRTNIEDESPMVYQPMMPVYPDVQTPMRYYPQPNLGNYEYPASTGMVQGMPIQSGYVAPVPQTGVLQEEALPAPVVVPALDARKDAARRIMAVENSKANKEGGWDAKTGRWYPHRSHEGGADTIAYGIKLSNGTPEAALALKQGYLTDQQAEHFVDTLVNKYYDAAKKVYDKKYGEGEWDKLSDKSQSILVDYSYNPGLAKFPKLMEGFHSGNMDLIRQNYKRYVNGKELGRNKTLLEEIETLGNEHPIFRADGGSVYRNGGKSKRRKDFNPSALKKAIVDVVGPGYYPNLVNVHGDFSRFYWGRPQERGILVDSPYSPTKSNVPDAKYYRVNDSAFLNDLVHLYNSSISHDLMTQPVSPLLNIGDSAVLSGYDARNNSKSDDKYVGDTLERHLIRNGRAMGDAPIEGASVVNYPLTDSVGALGYFTVGRGNDENGDYLSYYDNWDLNGHTKITRAVEKYGLGKPYEIYDRIYGTFGENGEFHPLGEIDPAIISSEKASGGKIRIKPSKRGTFTAAAKKHGKSVQAFASQVLAHKENYSPAMVKKANFARNAARWHADGGILERYDADSIRQAIQNARERQKK